MMMNDRASNHRWRTTALLCLLIWAFSLKAGEVGTPVVLSDQVASDDAYMALQLRGILRLSGDSALAELSDLAWDEDEQLLYGVTDRGRLLHLRPKFTAGQLTGLDLVRHYPLREENGKATSGSRKDAEGLALEGGNNGQSGDSRLLVSFERNHRILRYSPQGEYDSVVEMPPAMQQSAVRPRGNHGMEALALHPTLGMITGSEKTRLAGTLSLFSSKGGAWSYPTVEAADALVALEATPNGDLLILHRSYQELFLPLVITLTRVSLSQLEQQQRLTPRVVARFDTTEGWRTQNFEGLTRHQGNRYFMVSDDNGKPWASTQLIYFELQH